MITIPAIILRNNLSIKEILLSNAFSFVHLHSRGIFPVLINPVRVLLDLRHYRVPLSADRRRTRKRLGNADTGAAIRVTERPLRPRLSPEPSAVADAVAVVVGVVAAVKTALGLY